MSGTEQHRSDLPQVGFSEVGHVKPTITDCDGGEWQIDKERACLRKFDGEWTAEQMSNGEAEAAGALAEVLVLEDGEVVDHWVKGDPRDAPS